MADKPRRPRTPTDIGLWLVVGLVFVGAAFLMILGKPTNCPADGSSLATSLPSCRGMTWTQED